MKVGNPIFNPDFEVHLPLEIVELVLAYLYNEKARQKTQKTFWACSLVSKTWYYAAVPLLYRAPKLSGKNFEEFARTLCPPVGARKTFTGLENYVKHLDMGHLAYETRRSITARLIRRTKQCLETFTAPAVSFSVNCLAPLSKCSNLTSLDMSSDSYDIPIAQLLSSLASLERLQYLSLPKRAMPVGIRKEDLIEVRSKRDSGSGSGRLWPPNLTHLTMNHGCPVDYVTWLFLARTFPTTLHTLSLLETSTRHIFHTGRDEFLASIPPAAAADRCSQLFFPHITTLTTTCDYSFNTTSITPIEMVAHPFPNLHTLAITDNVGWTPMAPLWIHNGSFGPFPEIWRLEPTHLQHLIFIHSPSFPGLQRLSVKGFQNFVDHYPKLVRFDAPDVNMVFGEDESDEKFADEFNLKLEQRLAQMKSNGEYTAVEEAGVFLTEVDPAAFGMKRSLRYEGDQ